MYTSLLNKGRTYIQKCDSCYWICVHMTAVYSVYTHKPFNNSYFKRRKYPCELFKVYQLNSFKDNDIQVWTLTLGEHVYRKCCYGIEEGYKEICVPGMCASRIHSKDMCA